MMIIPRAETVLYCSDIKSYQCQRLMLLLSVCNVTNYEVVVGELIYDYIGHRDKTFSGFLEACRHFSNWYPEKRLFSSDSFSVIDVEKAVLYFSTYADDFVTNYKNSKLKEGEFLVLLKKMLGSKEYLMGGSISVLDIMALPLLKTIAETRGLEHFPRGLIKYIDGF